MAGAAPGTTFGADFILSGSWSSWSCQTATSFVFIGSTMPDASFKPSKPSDTCRTGSWSCHTMARNCRMLPSNPSNPPKPSKPALGAASCGRPSLSFSIGPKLPDAPFKPFKPSETCETGSWKLPAVPRQVFPFLLARNCRMLPSNPSNPSNRRLELPAVAGQVFPLHWPETAGCSLQTLQTLRNLRNRRLELPAVARQVFPFLLARNCRMLPSKPSNPPKPARPALGAASCATPSLSFSTGPKLPDAPFKPSETGARSCQLWQAKSFLLYLGPSLR